MPTSVKTVGRNNLNSHLFEGFSPLYNLHQTNPLVTVCCQDPRYISCINIDSCRLNRWGVHRQHFETSQTHVLPPASDCDLSKSCKPFLAFCNINCESHGFSPERGYARKDRDRPGYRNLFPVICKSSFSRGRCMFASGVYHPDQRGCICFLEYLAIQMNHVDTGIALKSSSDMRSNARIKIACWKWRMHWRLKKTKCRGRIQISAAMLTEPSVLNVLTLGGERLAWWECIDRTKLTTFM